MMKSMLVVSDLWDTLPQDSITILHEAFTDESRALIDKWNAGKTHLSLRENRAVGKFLVDIGAVKLQVNQTQDTEVCPVAVEVHCIRACQRSTSLASRHDAKEREDGDNTAPDERVPTETAILPPGPEAADEHGRESDNDSSSSWTGGNEDVDSDESERTDDIVYNVINHESEGTTSPKKDGPLKGDNKEAKATNAPEVVDGNCVVANEVNQLQPDLTVSTNESSQVQVANEAKLQASVHKCSICDSSLPSIWELDWHYYKCKTKNHRYHCYLCNKSIHKKGSMFIHLHKVHGVPASEILERLPGLLGAQREESPKNRPNHRQTESETKKSKKRANHRCTKAGTKKRKMQITRKRDDSDDASPEGTNAQIHLTRRAIQTFVPDPPNNSSTKRITRSSVNHVTAVRKLPSTTESMPASDQCPAANDHKEDNTTDLCRKEDTETEENGTSSVVESSSEQVANGTFSPRLDKGGSESGSNNEQEINKEMEFGQTNQTSDDSGNKEVEENDVNGESESIILNTSVKAAGEGQAEASMQTEGETPSIDEIKKGEIKCYLCDKSFRCSRHVAEHITKDHFQDYFNCSTCGKKFFKATAYKAHLEKHGNPNVYQCDICDRSFSTIYVLKSHKDMIHTLVKKFKCDICGSSFRDKGDLRKHMNGHTKAKKFCCEHCDKIYYSRNGLQHHVLIHNNEIWKCDECDGAFHSQGTLNLHKRKVHIPSSYLCDLCGARYKCKSSLNQHHVTAHTDIFKFTCDICGKKFKKKSNLTFHIKVHLDIRPHQCQVCEKSFRTGNNLRVHMKWHNNVRAHKCTLCDMSFLTKGNLDKHMQKHNKVKKHHCESCGHGFADLTTLRKHMAKVHDIIMESNFTKASSGKKNDPRHMKKTNMSNSKSGATEVPPHGYPRVLSEDIQDPVSCGLVTVTADPQVPSAAAANAQSSVVSSIDYKATVEAESLTSEEEATNILKSMLV